MYEKKSRFQLSPKLKLGIGRRAGKSTYLKYTSAVFVVVSIGLSLNAGFLIFTKDEENQSKPQVAGISDSKAINKQAEFETYTVKKGDTLFNIAQKFQISWTTLATLNNIESPFTVSTGQEIKIPKQ